MSRINKKKIEKYQKDTDKKGEQVSVYPPIAVKGRIPRNGERPETNTQLYKKIYKNDSIVGASLDQKVDYAFGAGVSINFINIHSSEERAPTEFPDVYRVLRRDRLDNIIKQFGKDGLWAGNGYIELICEDSTEPIGKDNKIVGLQNIPPERVYVKRDENMNIEYYWQDIGRNENNPTFTPDKILHFKNRELTGEPFGVSDIQPVAENSEILRNMLLDLSEFIETKAFPPVLWKCGREDKPWSPENVRNFIAQRTDPEPGEHIGVSGDVSAEPVGVSDQAMDVQPTMNALASTIVNGMRTPAATTSIITDVGQFVGETQTKAYSRHISNLRREIGEIIETQLLDPLLDCYGHSNYISEITWNKHNDEEQRLNVNNVIQLVQNRVITIEYAQKMLGFPLDMEGHYLDVSKARDSPENSNPYAQGNHGDENEPTDGDGRQGSRRMNVDEK